jgi:hypothetical protein
MSTCGWKYTYASTAGTSHLRTNKPCQDSSCCKLVYTYEGKPVLLAVASDGAGSAKCAEIGSNLVCSLVISELEKFFEIDKQISDISREFVIDLLVYLRQELSSRADEAGLKVRDYACTILVAVVGQEDSAFIQLGDGAIVVSSSEEPDEFNWIFWPQKGEYENTTYFVSDESSCDNVCFDYTHKAIDKISILTDGLQSLALHYSSQTVHTPFFKPLFTFLNSTKEEDADKLAIPLLNFLNSYQVNERTDDDKTLVLATRQL